MDEREDGYEEIDVGGDDDQEVADDEERVSEEEEEPAAEPKDGDGDDAQRRESGLIHEAQTERTKRQDAEARVVAAEAELRVLRQQMTRPQGPAPEERPDESSPLDGLPEDEPVYPGTLKQVIAQVVSARDRKAAEEKAAEDEASFHDRLGASREDAITNLSEKACGKGLDYLTVANVGEKNLTAGDILDIKKARNPAQLAYKRCIERTPELQELVETRKKEQWIEELSKPKTKKGESETADEADDDEEPDVVTQRRVVGYSAEIAKVITWPKS